MSEVAVKPLVEFLVAFRSHETGQHVRAHEAVVEPCGALSLYLFNAEGGRSLKVAYAPGSWYRVTRGSDV